LFQGVRFAVAEKIILGSASIEASPCGIFSAPPLETKRKPARPAAGKGVRGMGAHENIIPKPSRYDKRRKYT
jgi:hypothetical protein